MTTRETKNRPVTQSMCIRISTLHWIHVLIIVSHISWQTGTDCGPTWHNIVLNSWRTRMAWSHCFLQQTTVGWLWTWSITYILEFNRGLPTRPFGSISAHLSHNSNAHTSAIFHDQEQPHISWVYTVIMLRHVLKHSPTYSKHSTGSVHHRTWNCTDSFLNYGTRSPSQDDFEKFSDYKYTKASFDKDRPVRGKLNPHGRLNNHQTKVEDITTKEKILNGEDIGKYIESDLNVNVYTKPSAIQTLKIQRFKVKGCSQLM